MIEWRMKVQSGGKMQDKMERNEGISLLNWKRRVKQVGSLLAEH